MDPRCHVIISLAQEHRRSHRDKKVFCFLSSLHPPPPTRATTTVFGSHLSSLNSTAGAGLLIHMIGEVSWETKKDERLSIFFLSGWRHSFFLITLINLHMGIELKFSLKRKLLKNQERICNIAT